MLNKGIFTFREIIKIINIYIFSWFLGSIEFIIFQNSFGLFDCMLRNFFFVLALYLLMYLRVFIVYLYFLLFSVKYF